VATDLSQIGSEINDAQPADADKKAKQEGRFFGDERRSEQKKETIHRACMTMISVIGFCITFIIVVRIYHLFMPEDWCWLKDDRVQALDKFFFSGTIGALLTSFLKKSFSTKDD
jgi:hypothetical protein